MIDEGVGVLRYQRCNLIRARECKENGTVSMRSGLKPFKTKRNFLVANGMYENKELYKKNGLNT